MILFFTSCEAKNKKSSSNEKKEDNGFANPIFDNTLKGLNKNYVVNFDESNNKYLLDFYKKTEQDFKKDSIDYFNSVHSFYKCDSSILNYLTQRFKADTGICSWIYSHHPHSSNIKQWELKFTKEQGAAVLIYDYLMYGVNKSEESITTSPDKIEKIVSKINLHDFEKWLLKMNHKSLGELKNRFKQDFFPD